MITLKRCATCWKKICATFKEYRFDGTPKETIDKILEQMSFEEARTTFAVIAALKRHDGRIWGYNREWMNKTPLPEGATDWSHSNPMLNTNLMDEIHPAHIDQLISELRRRESK